MQHGAVDGHVRSKRRTPFLVFSVLLETGRVLATATTPPRHALFPCPVGEHTTPPHDAIKLPLLVGSGLEFVLVGLARGCGVPVP